MNFYFMTFIFPEERDTTGSTLAKSPTEDFLGRQIGVPVPYLLKSHCTTHVVCSPSLSGLLPDWTGEVRRVFPISS